MSADKLFSFQDLSVELNISEYEEAILERDKIIKSSFATIEDLKISLEEKQKNFEENDLKCRILQEKNNFYKNKMKLIIMILKTHKKEMTDLKTYFQTELEKLKTFSLSNLVNLNENIHKKQIKKGSLHEKLQNLRNLQAANLRKNKNIPYLGEISKNIKNLEEKVNNMCQNFDNFREKPSKTFLINYQENHKNKKDVINDKSTKCSDIEEKKSCLKITKNNESQTINTIKLENNNCLDFQNKWNYLSSPIKTKILTNNFNLHTQELEKIRTKYYGLDQKFQTLFTNKENKKTSSARNIQNTKISEYLIKISKKLGDISEAKEKSYRSLLNTFNSYQSF